MRPSDVGAEFHDAIDARIDGPSGFDFRQVPQNGYDLLLCPRQLNQELPLLTSQSMHYGIGLQRPPARGSVAWTRNTLHRPIVRESVISPVCRLAQLRHSMNALS